MRGTRLYNQLLFDDVTPPELTVVSTGGRSPILIESRDRFLLHRLYFKSKIERKIYIDVLNELEKEVWLSRLQIQRIIQSKSQEALAIKKSQPSISDLRKEWPHINW